MKAMRVFIVLILGGMVISSCGKPKPIICPPGYVTAPILVSPPNYAYTTSTTPSLSWKYKSVAYPYPQPAPTPPVAYKCRPQQFRISLSKAPLHNVELGAVVPGALSVTWTTPVLQSGQTYRWSVIAISKGQEGPPSEERWFSIGNTCASAADLKAPSGLWPPYGTIADTLTPEIVFSANSGMTCLPKGYVIQYSHTQNFGQYEWTTGIGPVAGFRMNMPTLQNCTTYYWRVAAHLGTEPGAISGAPMPSPTSPYSDPMMFEVAVGGSCVQPAVTVLPQALVTQPPGPLPPVSKLWQVTMNANCRAGPGTAYNERGFAPQGFEAKIEGRNEDGSWFRLIDPHGVACWVSRIALQVPQDWETWSVLAYPLPPPTEKPPEEVAPPGESPAPSDPCAAYTTVQACLAQPGCFFDRVKGICRTR